MPRFALFLVFFSVLSSLLGGAHYYFYARLVVAPGWPAPWTSIGAWLCLGLALLSPLGMILGRVLKRERGRYVAALGYFWLGQMLLFVTVLGLSEIVRLFVAALVSEQAMSRGIAYAVLGIGALAGGYGVASAIGSVAVKRVAVALTRLPGRMSGFKLVQLSDIHIGPLLGRSWLERVVARVNALEPDAVVITGDLVDGSVRSLRDQVAPLGDLRAKHGVFFVTGNHEYYSGVDAWLAELARLGIRSLRNERVRIGDDDDSFDLAGVDDWRAFGDGHGRDLKRALDGRDDSRELVLLAHQPKQVREAADRGVGLQLSGHTHGGQIFPWNFFVRLEQPYIAGHYQVGDTQLYVSCGTGFWGPPMRVGAPAEITLLTLESAGA